MPHFKNKHWNKTDSGLEKEKADVLAEMARLEQLLGIKSPTLNNHQSGSQQHPFPQQTKTKTLNAYKACGSEPDIQSNQNSVHWKTHKSQYPDERPRFWNKTWKKLDNTTPNAERRESALKDKVKFNPSLKFQKDKNIEIQDLRREIAKAETRVELLKKRRHLSTISRRPKKIIDVNGTVYRAQKRKLQKVSMSNASASTTSTISGPINSHLGFRKTSPSKTLLYRGTSSGRRHSLWRNKSTKADVKSPSKRKHCLFFTRFGRCAKIDTCPYEHDPDRVAVCTRFLRGTCGVTNCPYSHKVAEEKMPVCSYFLKGTCSKNPCPYLHVRYREDALVCRKFAHDGFCPQGACCKQKHVVDCGQQYAALCDLGRKCSSHGSGGKVSSGGSSRPELKKLDRTGTFGSNVLDLYENEDEASEEVHDLVSHLIARTSVSMEDSNEVQAGKILATVDTGVLSIAKKPSTNDISPKQSFSENFISLSSNSSTNCDNQEVPPRTGSKSNLFERVKGIKPSL